MCACVRVRMCEHVCGHVVCTCVCVLCVHVCGHVVCTCVCTCVSMCVCVHVVCCVCIVSYPDPIITAADGLHHRYVNGGSGKLVASSGTTVCLILSIFGTQSECTAL